MIPGIDLLGMASAKWNIKATRQALMQSNGVNIGLFADETFGPLAIQNAIKCLDTGKVIKMRVHLNWAGPNPKHTLPPVSKIKELAPKWEKLAKQYPNTRFFVSPSCEYGSTDPKAVGQMLKVTANLCPSCTIVHNPLIPVNFPGVRLERHADVKVKTGQILSYDGGSNPDESVYDIDVTRWINDSKNAEIIFAWALLCNMAEAHNTLPPTARTESPSLEFTKGLIYLFEDPGTPPTPSFQAIPLKKPCLYKSFSEDSQGADKRNNRPLIITPEDKDSVELITKTGATIGKFVKYGQYSPGLYRYYSGWKDGIGLYGWQIADKCAQMSGSPYGYYRIDKKIYGPIHWTFRTGYFH